MARFLSALLLVGQLLLASSGGAATPDREYVIGYASALLDTLEPPQPYTLEFDEGVLTVGYGQRPEQATDRLLRMLESVEGVDAVSIEVAGVPVAESEPREDAPEAAPAVKPADRYDFFSLDELFDPLLADPRWPRFSASHLWFFDDEELERVGAANFGETFVLVRSPKGDAGQWEFAFQAGVFSVFDLEASSSDLVNSDFWVGVNFTHHVGDFTWLIRAYHQSSHLGDEYLLRTRTDRVNLSFEVLDGLISWEPAVWLRLYAGGGVIVHREPALDRGLVQTGIELESPRALAGGFLRPVASFDLQLREESDWETDSSVRAGVQVEHPFLRRGRLYVLGEFYSGRSPNGQFYERRIKTLGLGIHLGF